eukprot:CAMPEP_0177208626 /NCGR_PEP_ID=MMETSP0367-20130122/30594_1 /TAXON_ID=447022 ORGANISM="Scrippsiella hangoei-like, Strain SHHI-4" /NCGR_SAMPLE_ID=MMETSP0367 /ASSEMBLY_ACC=CAM_ASM_000362 /LENGTH=217 /DNA_ID=CAMNT_0018657627 /DNA_START=266 /DNA_END=915 /DNA_ORIENTATION=-
MSVRILQKSGQVGVPSKLLPSNRQRCDPIPFPPGAHRRPQLALWVVDVTRHPEVLLRDVERGALSQTELGNPLGGSGAAAHVPGKISGAARMPKQPPAMLPECPCEAANRADFAISLLETIVLEQLHPLSERQAMDILHALSLQFPVVHSRHRSSPAATLIKHQIYEWVPGSVSLPLRERIPVDPLPEARRVLGGDTRDHQGAIRLSELAVELGVRE